MKAVVAAFNQEKALVGAFSVITNLRMELFEALGYSRGYQQHTGTYFPIVRWLLLAARAELSWDPEPAPAIFSVAIQLIICSQSSQLSLITVPEDHNNIYTRPRPGAPPWGNDECISSYTPGDCYQLLTSLCTGGKCAPWKPSVFLQSLFSAHPLYPFY